MSRLYATIHSDARKSEATTRGHEAISGRITWGHKDNPKTALRFDVVWDKDQAKPTVSVMAGNGVILDNDLSQNPEIKK